MADRVHLKVLGPFQICGWAKRDDTEKIDAEPEQTVWVDPEETNIPALISAGLVEPVASTKSESRGKGVS